MMGDAASTEDDHVSLAIEVEGSAPIERIDIFDGLEHLQVIRPWSLDDSPNRLRITCAGQHYRGRGRLVRWTGEAKLTAGKIERIAAINFWNPHRQPEQTGENMVRWQTVTTGGSSSLDLWIDESAWSGEVVLETSETDAKVSLAELTADGEKFPCGGMDIRLMVSRLPGALHQSSYADAHQIALAADREARVFVRVTQEDGHQAWSSPIYIQHRS